MVVPVEHGPRNVRKGAGPSPGSINRHSASVLWIPSKRKPVRAGRKRFLAELVAVHAAKFHRVRVRLFKNSFKNG